MRNYTNMPQEVTLGVNKEDTFRQNQPALMLTSSQLGDDATTVDDTLRFPKPSVTQKLHQIFTFIAKKEALIEKMRNRLARMT